MRGHVVRRPRWNPKRGSASGALRFPKPETVTAPAVSNQRSAVRFPGFTWDAVARRYRDRSGRFASQVAVRTALDRALEVRQRQIRQLADSLRAGRVSLDGWTLQMREHVKAVQLYSGALAKGGWGELTQADYGRIGQEVRQQYAYLHRLRLEIEAGLPLDGRFGLRAGLYGEAGRATYHRVERAAMEAQGMTRERSVLTPADHCDTCVAEAARGFVAIGELIPVGQRDCLSRCKCYVVYE